MNRLTGHLITLFLSLLLTPWQASAFVSELWPNEGRPVFRSKVVVLFLHEQPSVKSKIKKQEVERGKLITFDETQYRNVRSGTIRVLKAASLRGRNFGTSDGLSRARYYSDIPERLFDFKHGESIEYLQDRAEGSCIIKRKGEIIELSSCPWLDETSKEYQIISKPINEWWIRVVMNKKSIGWLLIDDKTVAEDRKF